MSTHIKIKEAIVYSLLLPAVLVGCNKMDNPLYVGQPSYDYRGEAMYVMSGWNNVEKVQQQIFDGIDEVTGMTALGKAAKAGDLKVMFFLLNGSLKANINAQDRSGNTALHYAVLGEHLNVIKTLLARGADIAIANLKGATPFHGAVYRNCLEIVRLFMRKGDATLLEQVWGEVGTALHIAILREYSAMVELLLESDNRNMFKIAVEGRSGGKTPLDLALDLARRTNDRTIAALLLNKIDPSLELYHEYLSTPLHVTVWFNDLKFTEFLLKKQAEVNVKNHRGETPLDLAIGNKSNNMVELLIRYGANVEDRDHLERTPLYLAVLHTTDANSLKIVQTLVNYKKWVDPEGLRAYLSARSNKGDTALSLAVEYNNLDVALFLIANGANVNEVFSDDWSLLHIAAACYGNLKMVKLLVRNGADVTHRNRQGDTPRMAAEHWRQQEVAYWLQRHGG